MSLMNSLLRTICLSGLMAALLLSAPQNAEAASTTEIVGDIIAYGMPVVVLGTTWHKGDKEGLWQFGKTWASSVAITYGLKYAINSERPNGDDHSFPSGHSASAFSTASYVHMRYGMKRAWPAYLAAGFTAWSRVDADEHHWEDVIGGAVIGHVMARIFTDKYEKIPPLQVTFNTKQDVYAIRTAFKF